MTSVLTRDVRLSSGHLVKVRALTEADSVSLVERWGADTEYAVIAMGMVNPKLPWEADEETALRAVRSIPIGWRLQLQYAMYRLTDRQRKHDLLRSRGYYDSARRFCKGCQECER